MREIAVAILMLFMGGCAVIHPTDPYEPSEKPSGVRESAAAVESISAGAGVYAPDVLSEGALTLGQAVDMALAANPEVSAKRWEAEAAEARRGQVFAERLPSIGVVGTYMRHLDEQRILPVRQPGDPAILSRDIISEDVVLSMPLFTGGRLVNRVKAAELMRDAAGHRLVRSREELVFDVSSVFFSILAQERVVGSLEFSRQTMKKHLERVEALVAARKAAGVDRLRTEVRLADIEQKLLYERNLLAVQRRALANLAGYEPGLQGIELREEPEMFDESDVPDFETALATAWKKRGDYMAARCELEADARNVDAARASRWPVLSLQGAYGGRWAAGTTVGAGDEFGDAGRIGIGFEMPLFEGGGIGAKIRESRADLAAARERLRGMELGVRLEIETALLGVSSSLERAEALRKSIEQAKESLRIEQQKYDLGMGAIVDVLDAQAALLETETTYYQVQAGFRTALARLKLAMGVE
jgi:outer membrane protein TolC